MIHYAYYLQALCKFKFTIFFIVFFLISRYIAHRRRYKKSNKLVRMTVDSEELKNLKVSA